MLPEMDDVNYKVKVAGLWGFFFWDYGWCGLWSTLLRCRLVEVGKRGGTERKI